MSQEESLFQCFALGGGVALILLPFHRNHYSQDVQDVVSKGKKVSVKGRCVSKTARLRAERRRGNERQEVSQDCSGSRRRAGNGGPRPRAGSERKHLREGGSRGRQRPARRDGHALGRRSDPGIRGGQSRRLPLPDTGSRQLLLAE